MMKAFIFSCLVVLGLQAETFLAQIYSVKDGDTMEFLTQTSVITCRVFGIDSPEKYDSNKLKKEAKKYNIYPTKISNAGKIASNYAKKYFSQNKNYQISTYGKDRYDRDLCVISDERGTYNQNILLDGFAVLYKNGKYIKESDLRNLSKSSQTVVYANKNGLWLDFSDLMLSMADD